MNTASDPILRVENLTKHFPLGGGFLRPSERKVYAVNDVSLHVMPGEIFGLVGESGSGKSTIGQLIMNLIEPTAGRIFFQGVDISGAAGKAMRKQISLVFQDPYSSLNPRRSIGASLDGPLRFSGEKLDASERQARVRAALDRVGLPASSSSRYPHEFSGGQRQRIGIARSLVTNPSFIVADEPVSALDVSVQAQVINLLLDIRAERGISMLFVAHDLAVVGYACDRIAVVNLGRIVEIAPKARLFSAPHHPYTEALFESAPAPDPRMRGRRRVLTGDIPSPIAPPSGCVFRSRCRYALDTCATTVPALRDLGHGHWAACLREDLKLAPWAGTASA